MKIGIYNVGVLYQYEDKYWTLNPLFLFVEELAKYINICVIVPVYHSKPPKKSWIVNSQLFEVYQLSSHNSLFSSYFAFIKDLFNKKDIRKAVDYYVLMDVLFPYFWIYLFKYSKENKVIVYLRANEVSNINIGSKSVRNVIVSIGGRWAFFILKKYYRNIPILAAGKELYHVGRGFSDTVFEVSPSVISISDSYEKTRNLNMHSFNILYVGRLSKVKGIEILINSYAMLSQAVPDVYLRIVGEDNQGGEYRKKLERMCDNLSISEKVFFYGRVNFGSDLIDIYKKSDIFVLPSYSEGRPKVIYEAMLTSNVVVATRVGGIPDVISHNINGLLVKPGSTNDLYSALLRLCTDPAFFIDVLKRSYADSKEYTLEASALKFFNALNAIREVTK